MKVLFVGATGSIGSEVLDQCLAHPAITSVIAFSRRELSSQVSSNPKLQVVIMNDFSEWPEGVLEAHADAEAMVWMMGAYNADENIHINYPHTFQQSFLKVLKSHPQRHKFRDIHLSGRLVVQDQERELWFMPAERKAKGRFETKALAFAAENSTRWQTFMVKPAAVVTKGTWGGAMVTALLSKAWTVRADEFGAFVAGLAVRPDKESGVIENARMAVEGKAALEAARMAA